MIRRWQGRDGGERDAALGRRTLALLRAHLGDGVVTAADTPAQALPRTPGASAALHGVFFSSWTAALEAARALARRHPGLPLLRVANAHETRVLMAQAADRHACLAGALSAYLVLRCCGHEDARQARCLLQLGADKEMLAPALGLCRAHGGLGIGRALGEAWRRGSVGGDGWPGAAMRHGYAAGALEAAVGWEDAAALIRALERSAAASFAVQRERVLTRISLSHPGAQGAEVHARFVYRRSGDAGEDLRRWNMLEAAVRRIAGAGGTIGRMQFAG